MWIIGPPIHRGEDAYFRMFPKSMMGNEYCIFEGGEEGGGEQPYSSAALVGWPSTSRSKQ